MRDLKDINNIREIKDLLTDIIQKASMESALNGMYALSLPEEPMWDKPLVGYSSGGDDYFKFWKTDIGEQFWSPAEAFGLKHRDAQVSDEQLTVISIAYPQTAATRKDQAGAEIRPCPRWSVTRGEWEKYIGSVCRDVAAEFEKIGIRTAAIDQIPEFTRFNSKKYGIASSWSHRHAAFVAGLGTFGLSDGLITSRGKAMRFSTLIIDKILVGDPRPYTRYNEWCLHYSAGTCGKCIDRCPVGAITQAGHDKEKCDRYLSVLLKDISPEISSDDLSHYYGCGLCQSRIPCQDGIPAKIKQESTGR